jgi:zinc protease
MSLVARIAPALLVILLTGACSAARQLPGGAAPAAPPTRHVLRNGVRIVVQEYRASEVVALQLWVRAGGRDESPSELGLAHYLEHVLFKGTTSRPPGFVEREVEGVGGRMNAGTSHDYTYYHVLLPARQARAGIEMLADISQNASLDASVLEQEKQVVLEEMRLSEDTPRRHLGRLLFGVLFAGHPYGRPVIGTPELVRGLARDTLVSFYRRTYVPEALTLVVVGAMMPAEVVATATRTFGRFPRSGVRPLPTPVAPALRLRRLDVERPGAHAYLGMGWLAPKIDHADAPAVDLLVWILGQARSSRLVRALRDRLGLVNSIASGYSKMEAAGALTVTAQLSAAHVPRAEGEILAEIERLREEGVSEAERRRAVTVAESRQAFATETAEGRAYAYGRAETTWRLEAELSYVERLRSVTAEQIQAAARRYLDPERYGRLAFLPPRR